MFVTQTRRLADTTSNNTCILASNRHSNSAQPRNRGKLKIAGFDWLLDDFQPGFGVPVFEITTHQPGSISGEIWPNLPPSRSNHVTRRRSSQVTGVRRGIALYTVGVETKKHMRHKGLWTMWAHFQIYVKNWILTMQILLFWKIFFNIDLRISSSFFYIFSIFSKIKFMNSKIGEF
jgi:hypothetical protein